MYKKSLSILIAAILIPTIVWAHFMVVQPSSSIVTDKDQSELTIEVRFAHPFEQGLMDMEMPTKFGVLASGKKASLLTGLKEIKKGNAKTYSAAYKINKPGDHIFYIEPKAYWEPAEDKFIIHYTKAFVHAFGLEEGWDEMVGFPIEIKPLTRPYGLWTGNVFQGQVLMKGKPVPNAEIEVTYDNKGKMINSSAEVFNIQVITADENGIFTYAMPKAGWWGFAALEEAETKLKDPDGNVKPIEIGGVIWVQTTDMK